MSNKLRIFTLYANNNHISLFYAETTVIN